MPWPCSDVWLCEICARSSRRRSSPAKRSSIRSWTLSRPVICTLQQRCSTSKLHSAYHQPAFNEIHSKGHTCKCLWHAGQTHNNPSRDAFVERRQRLRYTATIHLFCGCPGKGSHTANNGQQQNHDWPPPAYIEKYNNVNKYNSVRAAWCIVKCCNINPRNTLVVFECSREYLDWGNRET